MAGPQPRRPRVFRAEITRGWFLYHADMTYGVARLGEAGYDCWAFTRKGIRRKVERIGRKTMAEPAVLEVVTLTPEPELPHGESKWLGG